MVQVTSLLYVPFAFYYFKDVRLSLCFGPPAFVLESSLHCPVGHVPPTEQILTSSRKGRSIWLRTNGT